MKPYIGTKEDNSRWVAYFDRSIKLWTFYEVDESDNQIGDKCDYFRNKKAMMDHHGFKYLIDPYEAAANAFEPTFVSSFEAVIPMNIGSDRKPKLPEESDA